MQCLGNISEQALATALTPEQKTMLAETIAVINNLDIDEAQKVSFWSSLKTFLYPILTISITSKYIMANLTPAIRRLGPRRRDKLSWQA